MLKLSVLQSIDDTTGVDSGFFVKLDRKCTYLILRNWYFYEFVGLSKKVCLTILEVYITHYNLHHRFLRFLTFNFTTTILLIPCILIRYILYIIRHE